jgi:hypothetical protein
LPLPLPKGLTENIRVGFPEEGRKILVEILHQEVAPKGFS